MKHNPPYYTYMPEYASFKELVIKTTEKFPNDVVYSYRNKGTDKDVIKVTYSELLDIIKATGTKALNDGLKGMHVALVGKLTFQWVTIYLSMLSIGAVLVPLDPDWGAEELKDTINKAECKVVFYDDAIGKKINEVSEGSNFDKIINLQAKGDDSLEAFTLEGKKLVENGDDSFDKVEIDPSVLAELVFTSGTTGKGKGVMLSQKALLSNLFGAFAILKISKKTLGVLPPHHTYGSTISLMSAYANGTETYISGGLRYILKEMEEQKPEHLILVPLYMETFYRRIWTTAEKTGKDKLLKRMIKISNALRKVGIDLRKVFFKKSVLSAFGGELNLVVCGGAPLSQKIIDSFDDLGVKVMNGYGITECAPLISANRLDYRCDYSVGTPIPYEEVFIDNPNEFGEGEICIKGPHVMLGYFKDEEATKLAIDENGYFHTGDIGKLENEVVYITGRMKNLIILSNGKNVYPEEIESSLLTVPGVNEIVVYEGISKRGQEFNTVVAEIYPDQNYLDDNKIENAQEYFSTFVNDYNRTAVPYKKVGLVKIRQEEFPKNTLRKIMRFKIDKNID